MSYNKSPYQFRQNDKPDSVFNCTKEQKKDLFFKTLKRTNSSLRERRIQIMKFGTFTFQPQKPQGFDFHVLRVKT